MTQGLVEIEPKKPPIVGLSLVIGAFKKESAKVVKISQPATLAAAQKMLKKITRRLTSRLLSVNVSQPPESVVATIDCRTAMSHHPGHRIQYYIIYRSNYIIGE